jgi:uncharacterized membrane protein YhaH (DUF805 family)
MFKLLFSPDGYIHRLPYFLGAFILLPLFLFSLCMIWAIILSVDHIDTRAVIDSINILIHTWTTQHILLSKMLNIPIEITIIFITLIGLLTIWSGIALTIKRLRDLAITPWLCILPLALRIGMSFTGNTVILLIIALISIAWTLMLVFYPSRIE